MTFDVDRVGYLTKEQFASQIAAPVADELTGTFQPLDATLTDLAGRNIGAAAATDILDRAAGDGRYALSGSGVASFNTRTGAVTLLLADITGTGLAKGDIGLGNVDNTSDANKPVSMATATALALKLNSASYTAADVLAKLLTVDGSGSGLDADLLDGNSSAAFALSAQTLTAGAGLTGGGDLSANRTFDVGAGTGITVNANDVQLDTAHNRNVDHSAVSLTAGAGLTGGGDISASRSFAVGAGTGITVNADDVALDATHVRNAAHPASSTDNAVARYDGTAGALQDSLFVVDDSGHVTSFGGNFKFPATQVPSADANTLDDYEEGTFTPGLTFGGGSTGMTFSVQSGTYTKIGRIVIFNIFLTLSAKGSSTGTALLTGLPFTSGGPSPVATNITAAATLTTPMARVTNAATTINLLNFTGASTAAMTDANFTNTTSVQIGGFYIV